MSDVALEPAGGGASDPFRAITVAVMLVLGVAGFVGMVVLGAFAPDLRTSRSGGGNALSKSAVGLSGIVQLADATGRNPVIIRNVHRYGSEDLLVVTPDHGWAELGTILAERAVKPTLLVFPKWRVSPDPDHQGWVRSNGLLDSDDPDKMLSPDVILPTKRKRAPAGWRLQATRDYPVADLPTAPRVLQVITGQQPGRKAERKDLMPLITDGRGGIVLARYGKGPLYLLAEPDLLSNMGIHDPDRAAAGLAMLDWLNSTDAESIGFDVTMNGYGHSESPLKLAFTWPFAGMTIVLVTVLALIGWRALVRFGPAIPRGRAIALGKVALVENSAKLVHRARAEGRLGSRYVQLAREQAGLAFGAPPRLKGEALDAYLDGLGSPCFTDLAAAALAATDPRSLVAATRALHAWQQEKIR